MRVKDDLKTSNIDSFHNTKLVSESASTDHLSEEKLPAELVKIIERGGLLRILKLILKHLGFFVFSETFFQIFVPTANLAFLKTFLLVML